MSSSQLIFFFYFIVQGDNAGITSTVLVQCTVYCSVSFSSSSAMPSGEHHFNISAYKTVYILLRNYTHRSINMIIYNHVQLLSFLYNHFQHFGVLPFCITTYTRPVVQLVSQYYDYKYTYRNTIC